MRNALTATVILTLAAAFAVPAFAQDGDKTGRPDAGQLTIGYDFLNTSGDAGFVVSGHVPDWGYWGRWRSKLEYELDADDNVFTVAYALPTPNVPLGFRAQYGTGDAEGVSFDTDWVHPSDTALWLKTESDSDADIEWYSVDVGWWLPFGGPDPDFGVELFAGYFKNKVHFAENNIRVLEDPFSLTSGDFEGLVSTWDFELKAARLGARTEVPLLSWLSLNAEVAVLIGRAEGEGNWMLREYTFQQKADGTGVDAILALVFCPTENLAIQAGGRYYAFDGNDGTESGNEAGDEYHDVGIVEEITIDQLGWFVGVSYSF